MPLTKLKHLPTLPSLLAGRNIPLIHRDLSWLQFNERVLAEARAYSENPLLERLKFIAISATNLDEFFMIRFPSVSRAIGRARLQANIIAARRFREIQANLLEDIAEFGARQIEAFDSIVPDLRAHKIDLISKLSPEIEVIARGLFEKEILPHLSSVTAFKAGPVTKLRNLQLGVVLGRRDWIAVSKDAPPVLGTLDGDRLRFFFLDDLLVRFLPEHFDAGVPTIVRLTRDADYRSQFEEEDTSSIPDIVRSRLSTRDTGAPVRLQYRGEPDSAVLANFMRFLGLGPQQLYPAPVTLGLGGLWNVLKVATDHGLIQEPLMYPIKKSKSPKPFRGGNLFEKLKKHDFLLHHPYDSFDAFEQWLIASTKDPAVTHIELTIYRSGKERTLVAALKDAAKTKKIRVIIEARARFDELNNLKIAEELKGAGVEVTLGSGALKVHAKIALVTRTEDGKSVMYTHLSTGNYNPVTARQYTDLAIITANQGIGADARKFFDAVTVGKVPTGFQVLVPAPMQMHRKLLQHIKLEATAAKQGKKTRIVAKVNALVDESVIAALYEASQAGVPIDLIVRSSCSLIPGVANLSRSIRVISVVDRYLEHSRVYFFESQNAMYLSSADWMPRNFFSRLELAFPILDPRIYAFIRDSFVTAYLKDNQKSRELTQQGIWKRVPVEYPAEPFRSQAFFSELAQKDYEGSPLYKPVSEG